MWCDQQTTDVRLSVMEWETSLLGRKIGRVEGVDTTSDGIRAEALSALEQDALTSGFTLIVSRVDADRFAAVRALEASGFLLVDIGVTFQYDLAKRVAGPATNAPEDVRMREATADDIPALQEAVKGFFLHSYYYASPYFDGAEADLLHATWISNCVRKERAERVLLAEISGTMAGFVTCRMIDGHIGVIDLIGVLGRYGSRGIGKFLLEAALKSFLELGATLVKVRTQATNLAAANMYVATGARLGNVDATLVKSLSA